MGYSKYTHVGVYITVNNKQDEISETFYVNQNKNKVKTKFNPETGEQHQKNTITRQKIVSFHPNDYDVDVDYLEDNMYVEFCAGNGNGKSNYNTFIPNANDSRYSIEIDEEESFEIPPDFNRVDGIATFKEKHQDFLDFIESKGFDYTVRFGVVNYSM